MLLTKQRMQTFLLCFLFRLSGYRSLSSKCKPSNNASFTRSFVKLWQKKKNILPEQLFMGIWEKWRSGTLL